jgi:hypothetical protein
MTAVKHATDKPSSRGPGRLADKEPLQVRIPVTVKRRFKSYAALKGIEPHELFVEVWAFYEAGLKSDTASSVES